MGKPWLAFRKAVATDVDPVSFEMAQFFWYLDVESGA